MIRPILLTLILLPSSLASAQSAPPPIIPEPTVATTTSQPAAPDLSDPRKTYESSMLAILHDDPAAAVACVTAAKPEFLPLAHAMTQLELARHHLGQVAETKFGKLGLQFTGRTVSSDADLRKTIDSLKTAKLDLRGDTATLTLTDPVLLRKIDSQWKIDFSEAFTRLNLDAAEQAKIRDSILADIAQLRAFAKRVSANEFADVYAARAAWKKLTAPPATAPN